MHRDGYMGQRFRSPGHLPTQKVQAVKSTSGIAELLAKWAADASTMEQYSDARGAAISRLHIAELKEAVRLQQDEALTLSKAALESGFSEDHLRHQVAEGQIPNVGRKGAPRIRRADLPLKRNGQSRTDTSPETAAGEILRSLSS